MSNPKLTIEVKPKDSLSQDETNQIASLCSQAYEEDYAPYLKSFDKPTHVLGVLDSKLVCHALWITRWLQMEAGTTLRTAYVEAVATEASYRHLGYASFIMQRLAEEIQDYDIGALSPADTSLYARLGWEYWQGPLFARKDSTWILEPGENAMILRTSQTPALDLLQPISIEWREGDVW
jgi:aminoglycoside 2'-N-acetyltransferase I